MDEKRVEENIEIPDILLEQMGFRTTSHEVDEELRVTAGLLIESGRLVRAERFVEAGIMDFIKNIFNSGKFKATPENIAVLLEKLESHLSGAKSALSVGSPSALSNEEIQYAESLVGYLKNLNQKTRGGVATPFRKHMGPDWESLEQSLNSGDSVGIKHNLGGSAKHTLDAVNSFKGLGKLWNNRDRQYFEAIAPGVEKVGGGSVTFKELFQNASAVKQYNDILAENGDIVIKNHDALNNALNQLSNDVGTSATLKGWLQRANLLWKAALPAAGIALTGYGINAVGKNPVTTKDLDSSFSDGALGDVMKTNTPNSIGIPQKKPQSNGLGGATNGNNFGNFGGQLPDLATNKYDWLPTNTNASDYYKIVNNSEDSDNMRLAQNVSLPQNPLTLLGDVPEVDFEGILGHVFTILEQGKPSEQTLLFAKDYVDKEYAKVVPFLQKYEALQKQATVPERRVLSQVDPEVAVDVAKGAVNVVKRVDDAVGQDHRGEDKNKSESDDFLNKLDISQKETYSMLAGFGIDMPTAEATLTRLRKEGHMASIMQAVKFMQEIAATASMAHADFPTVFETGLNILKRQISSPDRAIAILRVIGKYEAMRPGLGLFNLANQAATGNYNPQDLFLIRFSLPAQKGKVGMDSSRDLQQAFDGINMPNTELGAELNNYNIVHQTYQQSQEMFLMRMQRWGLEIQKRREELLNGVMKDWYQSIPNWAKNNIIFKGIRDALSGIAYTSAITKTMMKGLGVGENGLVNPGEERVDNMGFVGASNIRVRKVLAQAGVSPVELVPSSTEPKSSTPNDSNTSQVPQTQGEQANQNIEQLNKGNASQVNDLTAMLGLQNTEIGRQISKLESIIPTLRDTLKTNYDNITLMLSSGNQGASQFDRDISSAPYATPEQIEAYASQAMVNAVDVVGAIIELLKIFQYIVQESASNPSLQKAVISSGLRQREAEYRMLLAEAQQMRVSIFDISVVGKIDQQIRLLEPKYTELETNIEMMAAFNNVGADAFVMPFVQVSQQMAQLYFAASDKYNAASKEMQQEPQMVQYCQQRAQQMQSAGAKARAKGITSLRNLMKQQGGGAVASTNKFTRIAEDNFSDNDDIHEDVKEVDAKPLDVDDYWNKLYKNNPPYGDVITHPEHHRDKPTWKMKSKHNIKRIH